jgi:hypothetical protein
MAVPQLLMVLSDTSQLLMVLSDTSQLLMVLSDTSQLLMVLSDTMAHLLPGRYLLLFMTCRCTHTCSSRTAAVVPGMYQQQ